MGEGGVRKQENKTKLHGNIIGESTTAYESFLIQTNCSLFTRISAPISR